MKILIIDHEIEHARLLKTILESEIKDLDIKYYNNYKSALELISKEHFDFLLYNPVTPDIDSIQFIKYIRKSKLNKDSTIFVITDKTDKKNRLKDLEFGVDNFITKPFEIDDLISKFKIHINEKKRLSKSEKHYQNILNKFNLLIYILNLNFDIINMNEKGKIYIKDTEKNKNLFSYFDIIDNIDINSLKQMIISNTQSIKINLKGKIFFKDHIFNANFFHEKSKSKIICILEDITEKQIHASKLLEFESKSSLKLIASSISHEINNILTGLIGLCDIVEMKKYEKDIVKKAFNGIKENSNKLSNIIKNLQIFLNNIDSNDKCLYPKKIIDDLAELINIKFKKKIINIEINIQNEKPINIPVKIFQFIIMNIFLTIFQNCTQRSNVIITQKNHSDFSYFNIEIIPESNKCPRCVITNNHILFRLDNLNSLLHEYKSKIEIPLTKNGCKFIIKAKIYKEKNNHKTNNTFWHKT